MRIPLPLQKPHSRGGSTQALSVLAQSELTSFLEFKHWYRQQLAIIYTSAWNESYCVMFGEHQTDWLPFQKMSRYLLKGTFISLVLDPSIKNNDVGFIFVLEFTLKCSNKLKSIWFSQFEERWTTGTHHLCFFVVLRLKQKNVEFTCWPSNLW